MVLRISLFPVVRGEHVLKEVITYSERVILEIVRASICIRYQKGMLMEKSMKTISKKGERERNEKKLMMRLTHILFQEQLITPDEMTQITKCLRDGEQL